MKFAILVLVSLLSTYAGAHEDWSIKDLAIDKTRSSTFIAHDGAHDGPTAFLAMNLNYEPFKEYFTKVDYFTYRPLKSRSEANIVVITPQEFSDDLVKFITMQEINEIAIKLNIQESSYKALCLGKGSGYEAERFLESYFIVVESENLLNIRKEISLLYKKRGGTKFDPLHFNPRIVIGFTDRDLGETDHVISDAKSCMQTLHISPKPSTIRDFPVANSSYVDKNKSGGALIRGNAPISHFNLSSMKKFGVSEVIIFKNDKAGEVKGEIAGLADLGLNNDKVTHIDFDWKDNQNFVSGCKKIVQGIDLLKLAMKHNKKLFFHCTTGEDRTGVLATSYLLATKKGSDIKKLFKNEMCAKGYEAGDPDKEKVVVERIRQGLTKTFLKTAYRIDEAKRKKLPITEGICATDPSDEIGFAAYSSQMDFSCEAKTIAK